MIKTFFDFCSGIGARRLGLERCGLKCVGHSDTSRLADKTYMLIHNTANDVNFGNLKKLGGNNLPDFDLLIAGFPCQTFSVIGRQAGFSDNHGQIIFHLSRILKEKESLALVEELEKEQNIIVKTALMTCLYMGLRRSELAGLQWQDINFEKNIMKIERSMHRDKGYGVYYKGTKTESSKREISIPNRLAEQLRNYKE